VDNIVDRGQKVGLVYKEWLGPDSCNKMQQLVVVSANRTVTKEFKYYAKGLELNKQLVYMFFDKNHIIFTNVLYRK
jgi:hypothetical protein